MKNFLKLTLIATLAALTFSSCSDDDGYSLDKYYVNYGTIKGTPKDYTILLDNGSTLYVSASDVFIHPDSTINNDRVILSFNLLGEAKRVAEVENYYIKLLAMEKILSKAPVMSTTADIEALGNDPIDVREAWFGGNYLNIRFNFYQQSKVHFINLLVDENNPKADADNVYVVLKHNAYGDPKGRYVSGMVSFDIASLVPEGKNSVKVHLSYENYDGNTVEDSGVFVIGTEQSPKIFVGVSSSAPEMPSAIK